MLNKKRRALVSLGAGILIFVGSSFSLLLILRLLNSPQWMYTVIIWILFWPTRLIGCFITIPYQRGGALAFVLAIGVLTDVAILSVLVYAALSLIRRKSASLPPPVPPPFQ